MDKPSTAGGTASSGSEEDELSVPRAALNKMIKELIPGVRVANDARELILACCKEFIHLVSTEANEICVNQAKKTISPDHILDALDSLGFGDYRDEAKAVFQEAKAVAAKKRRGSSRLENLGIPEEELLRQQQELFEKARQEQAQLEHQQWLQMQQVLQQQQLASQQQQLASQQLQSPNPFATSFTPTTTVTPTTSATTADGINSDAAVPSSETLNPASSTCGQPSQGASASSSSTVTMEGEEEYKEEERGSASASGGSGACVLGNITIPPFPVTKTNVDEDDDYS